MKFNYIRRLSEKISSVKRFKVKENSMKPLLDENDSIIALTDKKTLNSLKENDIVIAEINNRKIIKKIKFIEKNKFFLEGINKKESIDSRHYGLIKKNKIIGKFLFKY